MTRKRKRILVVFPKEWDREAFARGDFGNYEFVEAGFDLFRFPSNARLLTFDARAFVGELVERWRGRIDGVFSNNDYFGTLIAAAVAERLGLPGTPPAVVITAQHKYYARLEQRRIAPDAVPAFSVFAYGALDPARLGLPFPFYVKPVRATYSVLARRVSDFEELRRHLAFTRIEEWIIRRLVKPFNDLMPEYTGYTLDAHHLIAEEPLEGMQVNVDGYVREGRVGFLGLSDAVMYPGTDAFERFVYPSRVPAPVQERMRGLAERLLAGMDYRHGFFNIELMWNPRTDRIAIVEVNPRLASQLAGLYQRVDGIDPHRMLLELCTGAEPDARRTPTGCAIAASLVSRRFDGRPLARAPREADIASARARYPNAAVMLYLKRGRALAREMKWLGSYRCAVINMGAASEELLNHRYAEILNVLRLSGEPRS